MTQYQVTCINKRGGHYNPHERIEYIGNSEAGWKLSEHSALRRLKTGNERYYTLVGGRRADIIVAIHSGREYLKTTADGYSPDNLLNLPECASCKIIS